MDNVAQVRRFLPRIYLVTAITIALCYLTSFGDFFQQLKDLRIGAPAIRLTSLSILTIFLAAFVVLLSVALTIKAFALREELVKKLVSVLNVLAFTSFGLMVLLMIASTQLQNKFMPSMGYSRCDQLHGNPSMWSTDWVKKPDWCVKGKTRAWVNEQAALQAPKAQTAP